MIKRITAGCMAAVIAASAMPVFAKPVYKKGDNIAAKAKISASVMGSDATSTPQCLNDGEVPSLANGSTKWFVSVGTDGAWAEFTFPEPVNIKDAKVHGGMQNAAEKDIISGFKIQYYTPSGWKDAAEISENADFTIPVSFDGVVTSDRFRLLSTSKVRFRLTEVELYEAVESEAASEGGDVKTVEDVDGKYKVPVETVLNIGLLDGEYILNDEDMIKRGEFVKLLMDFIGETLPENTPESIFYDVKAGTDEAKAIARATELGIVKKEGIYFKPDNEMKYDEAAQMILSALGYDIYVEHGKSYEQLTSSLKITSGINRRSDRYINGCDALVMLYNMLDTKMVEGDVNGEYKTELTFAESREIYMVKDILRSSFYLQGGLETSVGRVDIGGDIYECASTNAAELAGYSVVAWYKEDGSDRILLHINIDEKKNEVTEHDSENIIASKTDFSIITYEDGTRQKHINIADDAKFFKNGGKSGITVGSLKPQYGRVTLIDNNGDSKADYVIIKDLKLIWADRINASDLKVYDKNYKNNVDIEGYDYVVLRNGNYDSFESILPGDIVSAEVNEQRRYARLYVSSKKLEGKAEAADEEALYLEGEKYGLPSFVSERPQPGSDCVCYFDAFGSIVLIREEKNGSVQYALLIRSFCDDLDMEKINVKLLCESGEINYYPVKDRFTLNKESAEPSALLSVTDRLIKYRLSNGEISAVWMNENEPEKEPEYLKDTQDEFVRYKNANSYYGTNNVLSASGNGRNLILTSDTIVFKTLVNRTGDEKRDYVVLRGGGVFNGKYASKTAEVYNINTDGIPEAIYYNEEKSAQQLSLSTPVGVVKKVSKIYDTVEEELKTLITFWYNGNELELIMDEDAVYNGAYNSFGSGFAGGAVYSALTPDQIKKGDVIQFTVENGKIGTYRIIAVASESDNTGILQQTGGDRPGVMPLIESAYGYIASYSDTTISVDVNGTIYTYLNASPNIYIYYKDGVTVEKADSGSIVSKLNDGVGSRVFIRVSSKAVRDIIIYK